MGDSSAKYSNGEVKIDTESHNKIKNGSAKESNEAELESGASVSEFLRNVKADFLNKNLLPLKILFFFRYASKSSKYEIHCNYIKYYDMC